MLAISHAVRIMFVTEILEVGTVDMLGLMGVLGLILALVMKLMIFSFVLSLTLFMSFDAFC